MSGYVRTIGELRELVKDLPDDTEFVVFNEGMVQVLMHGIRQFDGGATLYAETWAPEETGRAR